jgi:outer membrane protein TolC
MSDVLYYKLIRKITFFGFFCFQTSWYCLLSAQQKITLTMEEIIAIAQENSLDAMAVKNSYLANYWGYRSYKAELLPSLNFSANVGNFDRSQKALQDAGTGEIRYLLNNNMYNSGTLSIDQNIALTGGSLSFSSSLDRLDQYSPVRNTIYNTQPVTLRYLQPLWAYNRLKWEKKIQPERFEQAKIAYIESMEDITIKAVQYYFNLLVAQRNYEIAVNNYEKMKTMYGIASLRFRETGTVTRSELLQLELRMVNDSLSISTQSRNYQVRKMNLRSFLGYNDDTEIELIPITDVPNMTLDYSFVLENALENSSFIIGQKISKLEAERIVEQAKANRGVSVSLSARFGMSNNDERFMAAYSDLMNYEVVGLSVRVPIIDWGMSRGRIQMAEAQQKTTLFRQKQALNDYIQNIYFDVMEFNTLREHFRMARHANEIAIQRYELALQDFAEGTTSVTELNTAQSEKESANMKYLSEISNYWINYFRIRKLSVYDYINDTDISAEFDKLTNSN